MAVKTSVRFESVRSSRLAQGCGYDPHFRHPVAESLS